MRGRFTAAPANLGGTATLSEFLVGRGRWGFMGGKGFFLNGAGSDGRGTALAMF